MIDVVGVVTNVEKLLKLFSDNGDIQYKRVLNITDQSNIIISLNLWGNLVRDFNYKPGCVVIAQQAKVDNKKGTSLTAKYLYVNHRVTKATELKKWYIQNAYPIVKQLMKKRPSKNGAEFLSLWSNLQSLKLNIFFSEL